MNTTLDKTVLAIAASLLVMTLSNVAGAFPGRSGGCYDCHNDGSGSITPSPDPIEIKIGENGLLTFDVTELAAPGDNNMLALEDLSITELDASIGTGGDNWTLGTTATKSDQHISAGDYVLDLIIGQNAVVGNYQLNWRLAGSGPSGTTGLFHIDVIPAGLPGDYNNNGVVDAADYTVWLATLGQTGSDLAADGTGPGLDGTPDGVVDQFDYQFWKENFGNSSFGGSLIGTAVPEPSSAVLLLAMLLALSRGRPRAP